MSNIYTLEECKNLINELEIINTKGKQIHICKKKITNKLEESILFHTKKCNNKWSERIYWILNNIEDYPCCIQCGTYFKPRFYGISGNYHGWSFCSNKCLANNSDIRGKTKQTMIANHGVEYSSQSPVLRQKGIKKLVSKFGISHNFNLYKLILKKAEETYHLNSLTKDEVKQQLFDVNIINYNKKISVNLNRITLELFRALIALTPNCNNRISERIFWILNDLVEYPKCLHCNKEVSKRFYGFTQGYCDFCSNECSAKSELTKEKSKLTCIEKYGTECATQSKLVQSKHKIGYKKMVLPSGTILNYQGYENVVIKKLLELGYLESEIYSTRSNINSFRYIFEEKNRVYYPDIFIPKDNKIIEVKSEWTYNIKLEQNLLKKDAVINAGYNFEFWICSDKEVLKIIEYKMQVNDII
jgi:hypothetical protein